MEILNQLTEFIFSNEYWSIHGFVLSGLWVIVSAIAILAKRLNTTLHVLLFVIVDFTTLFFSITAIYRVSFSFDKFFEWTLLKQVHVVGGTNIFSIGILFLVMVILQHIGGVTAFFGNKPNPQHRSFGAILANIGRLIACVGWVLGGNLNLALYVAIASAIILAITLFIPKSNVVQIEKPSAKPSRSKSPKRE